MHVRWHCCGKSTILTCCTRSLVINTSTFFFFQKKLPIVQGFNVTMPPGNINMTRFSLSANKSMLMCLNNLIFILFFTSVCSCFFYKKKGRKNKETKTLTNEAFLFSVFAFKTTAVFITGINTATSCLGLSAKWKLPWVPKYEYSVL